MCYLNSGGNNYQTFTGYVGFSIVFKKYYYVQLGLLLCHPVAGDEVWVFVARNRTENLNV